MNSREKAEHLFSERYGGVEFFEEEIDILTELLDQHAAEQRQMCADAVTESRQHDGGITDHALRYACLNAVEAKAEQWQTGEPPRTGEYLVTLGVIDNQDAKRFVSSARFITSWNVDIELSHMRWWEVVAWQPLPAPYQGERR